ncbi:MAG: DUF2442 domain-containing protein [Bacteroidetes bacterium]|nr:DUF2442 domain-containing protein [Bacteroidota bacterium]
MFLEVIQAEYLREYLIEVTFNTGETKLVDLKESLQGPVFEPLKDINYFRQFAIHFNTLEWKNGADFAPEYLYRLGKKTDTPGFD